MSYGLDDCSDSEHKCTKMNNTQWIPFVTLEDMNMFHLQISVHMWFLSSTLTENKEEKFIINIMMQSRVVKSLRT